MLRGKAEIRVVKYKERLREGKGNKITERCEKEIKKKQVQGNREIMKKNKNNFVRIERLGVKKQKKEETEKETDLIKR